MAASRVPDVLPGDLTPSAGCESADRGRVELMESYAAASVVFWKLACGGDALLFSAFKVAPRVRRRRFIGSSHPRSGRARGGHHFNQYTRSIRRICGLGHLVRAAGISFFLSSCSSRSRATVHRDTGVTRKKPSSPHSGSETFGTGGVTALQDIESMSAAAEFISLIGPSCAEVELRG